MLHRRTSQILHPSWQCLHFPYEQPAYCYPNQGDCADSPCWSSFLVYSSYSCRFLHFTDWYIRRFTSLSLRRKYSGEDFRKHFTKSVSIVASISCDTFVLYLHVFSEYVRRVPKRPKYSPTVTIWLQKDEQNKNCNQEYVQRLFRVLICCCYSNDYVELCSGVYGSSFHLFRL